MANWTDWLNIGGGKPYAFLRAYGQYYINTGVYGSQLETGDSSEYGTGTLLSNGEFTASKDFEMEIKIQNSHPANTICQVSINNITQENGIYSVKQGDVIKVTINGNNYATFNMFVLVTMY